MENNVIRGPWDRSLQHHCNFCGSTEGRAVCLKGILACYDCVTELYWSAIQHETELRRAGEQQVDLMPAEYVQGL